MLNTIDEQIEVLQAVKAGKAVEIRSKGAGKWRTNSGEIHFNCHKYRVKPDILEFYCNIYGNRVENEKILVFRTLVECADEYASYASSRTFITPSQISIGNDFLKSKGYENVKIGVKFREVTD